MKKKILITGGLGYIGTELCRLYSGQSWYNHIVVIDKKFVSERVNQLRQWNIDFFQGDILDKEFIKKILKEIFIIFPIMDLLVQFYLISLINNFILFLII